MVAISRIKVEFTGSAVVGPAASSFFTTGQPDDLRGPLITLWTALRSAMPSSCVVTIPNSGETYEDTTGVLTGVWSSGTTYTQAGAMNGTFSRGVGMRLVWNTAGITNGRRVRGSTYVVPLGGAAYDTDGSIDGAIVSATNTNVFNFVAATQSDFTIWTRPRLDPDDAEVTIPGKTSGVTGGTCPDRVSWLRSRRV